MYTKSLLPRRLCQGVSRGDLKVYGVKIRIVDEKADKLQNVSAYSRPLCKSGFGQS